jgi:hypothetical protein
MSGKRRFQARYLTDAERDEIVLLRDAGLTHVLGGELVLLRSGCWSCPQPCPHRAPKTTKPRSGSGVSKYRHGDSNPGFRRERAAS